MINLPLQFALGSFTYCTKTMQGTPLRTTLLAPTDDSSNIFCFKFSGKQWRKLCEVENCEKEVKKKHMCAKHLREVSFAIVRLNKLCQKLVHKKIRIPIA